MAEGQFVFTLPNFHINVVYCEPKIISIRTASRNLQSFKNCLPELYITTFKRIGNVVVFLPVLAQPLPGMAQSGGRHPIPSSSFRTERKRLNLFVTFWLVWGLTEGLVSVSPDSDH